jgi:hypothetical protein
MKRLGHAGPYLTHERRDRIDRRSRRWWSIWYGSFNPRRRSPSRRLNDSGFHSLDWYSAHLLGAAIGILLLSVVDAFMTLMLLEGGADEVNPIMGVFVYRNVAMFAAVKMGMTGVSIICMVVLARYRFMRVLRVAWVLYGILVAYATLIGYELLLLNGPGALHIL